MDAERGADVERRHDLRRRRDVLGSSAERRVATVGRVGATAVTWRFVSEVHRDATHGRHEFAGLRRGLPVAPLGTMRPLRQLAMLLAVTFATLVAAPTSARAAEPPAPAPARETVWYGGPSLALDGGALVLVIIAAQDGSSADEALAVAGIAAYLLGAPTVHALNGEYGRALGSLALRTAVPVGTFYLVATAVGCETDPEDGADCFGGVIAGMLGAVIATGLTVAVDDIGLSRKTRPAQPSWAPTVAPASNGGMTFGVVGTF
jgi:hypothetical protein